MTGVQTCALPILFLPYAFDFNAFGLWLFAVFYGLDWLATVPPTARLAGLAFGEENAALMYAWIVVAHQTGAATAAWTAGFIRTEAGDYFGAFFSAGLLCMLAAILVSFIGSGQPRIAVGHHAQAGRT